MAEFFILQGISISIYGLDANPPHLHVKYGKDEFVITLDDREVEGKARFDVIKMVSDFIDEYYDDIMELWEKAQRGEAITRLENKLNEE